MHEVDEMLDRELAFLLGLSDEDFVAHLGPYLDAISADPRVRMASEDALREAKDASDELRRVDEKTVRALVGIRRELTGTDVDDSNAALPEDGSRDNPTYRWTLANFDHVAAKPPPAFEFPRASSKWKDNSRSSFLIEILKSKLGPWDDPRFGDLQRRLSDRAEEYKHASYIFRHVARTSAGVALQRLLQSTPRWIRAPRAASAERPDFEPFTFILDPAEELLAGSGTLDKFELAQLKTDVAFLRTAARAAHEGLRRRLYGTRSRRALVERFKLRTESYDRDRLRELSEDVPNPENRLLNEAARYLFDAGLTPLIGAQVGRLRPDALEHGSDLTFYLETKQYKDRPGALVAAKTGAKQVWDTAAVLKSIGLREAFLVIFRRAGPLAVLPEAVRANGIVIYPIVVAIAPAGESGSQQSELPVEIKPEDMLPQPAEGGAGGA